MEKRFHILLVEDDDNDVLLVKRAFRKACLEPVVHNIPDGEAAIDYLRGSGPYADRRQYPLPALVLLDLKLPRLGGHEVLRWIRSHPELRRLPVVVLTSSRELVDLKQAYDLGANSYLIKPVLFEGLLQMMTRLDEYWFHTNEHPPIEDTRP